MTDCRICGKPTRGKRLTRMYCSSRCNYKAHYRRNRAKIQRANRAWYAKNRERVIVYAREWAKKNVRRRRTTMRRYQLSLYGLTPKEYTAMLRRQRGKCAVCRASVRRLHVDHNHATGVVRGLLCRPCNNALGLMRDSARLLRRAATYLERRPPHETSRAA